MNDLIKREDAIDKIYEVYEYEFPTASGAFDEFVTMIIPNILRNLPSIEPEQTAKFRRDGNFLRCSKCWRIVDSGYNYCPGCGVKLDWSGDDKC